MKAADAKLNNPVADATGATLQPQKQIRIMKTLAIVTLGLSLLAVVSPAQAEFVQGYFRSDGTYVAGYYRTSANSTPYDNLSYRMPTPTRVASLPAIAPSHPAETRPAILPYVPTTVISPSPVTSVNGYFRSNGTYVAPYLRSAANSSPYDNLAYRR